MRTITRTVTTLLAATAACWLAGCAQNAMAPANSYSASHPAPNDDLIVPGQRVGPVYIGMSDKELYKAMGDPAKITPIAGNATFYCFGEQTTRGCDGIWTNVDDGAVYHIDVGGERGSKYHTSTQPPLAIGSSELQVRVALGEPHSCHTNHDQSFAHYLYYDGLSITVDPTDGKVTGIAVEDNSSC